MVDGGGALSSSFYLIPRFGGNPEKQSKRRTRQASAIACYSCPMGIRYVPVRHVNLARKSAAENAPESPAFIGGPEEIALPDLVNIKYSGQHSFIIRGDVTGEMQSPGAAGTTKTQDFLLPLPGPLVRHFRLRRHSRMNTSDAGGGPALFRSVDFIK